MQDAAWDGPVRERPAAVPDDREALLGTLAPVLDAVARVHGWSDPDGDLDASLQAVLEGILQATGFAAGAMSHVHVDGSMQIVAVVGPDEARASLLGVQIPPGALEHELAVAERWGRLRFIPAGTLSSDAPYVWVPDVPEPTEPDGWHPDDSLLAPLHAGSGRLIGILSVDLPLSGRRPDAYQRRLLELLAGQAETALQNARRAQRLRASEESFRLAFESTAVGMGLVVLDPQPPLRLVSANRALDRIAGAIGRDAVSVLADLLGTAGPDWVRAIRSAPGGEHRAEVQLGGSGHAGADPADRPWVQVTATALPLHTTEEGRAIVMVEDITERRRAQWDLEQRATRDALTGLPDRSVLQEHLAATLAEVRAGGPPGLLLFCDLDDFKSVNDLFGHLAGDAVLRAVAQRLREQVAGEGGVFRLGGDEFAVLVHPAPTEPAAVVERVRGAATAPVEHGGRRVRVGLSVGSCVVDGRFAHAEDLLALADAAMYRDKRDRHPRARAGRAAAGRHRA
ncbi:MAG: diguanylate cyclase [Pseudonocardiales bacterium]|nr:diguanylate cyclase [Pseudonocardiales bacterium]